MALDKIVVGDKGRIAQLTPGAGNNQQARASDLNTVIDEINAIESGNTIPLAPLSLNTPTGTITTLTSTTANVSGTATAGAVIKKPAGTTVAANTGTTLTAAMMLSGYVEVTGTTGSLALDTVANITTALGITPTPGLSFEFTINTKGATPMTATNVVTLTAPASTIFMKQFNTTDVGTAFIPTVTATDGIHVGTFRYTFQTATSAVVQRIG